MAGRRSVFIRGIPARLVLYCVGFLSACTVARADIATLGLFSLDVVNPGAVNGYSINNFTFGFALPPDFPIVDSVIFQNAKVILTDDNGTAMAPILIFDLSPGVSTPLSLEFLSTQLFQSAEFIATLSPLSFALFDGTVFTADNTAIDTLLLPSAGSTTLVAGVDFAPIVVNGTIGAVPEPSGWLLLLTLIVLCSVILRVRDKKISETNQS